MRSIQNNPPPTVKRKSRKKEKKKKDEDRRLRYNAATSLYRRGYPGVAKAGATVPPAFSKKEPSLRLRAGELPDQIPFYEHSIKRAEKKEKHFVAYLVYNGVPRALRQTILRRTKRRLPALITIPSAGTRV